MFTKKIFLIALIPLILLFLIMGESSYAKSCNPPHQDTAESIVPCGQYENCPCELGDIFILVENLYKRLLEFSTVLAGFLVVVGGVILLISAGSPRMLDLGKSILKWTLVGILLVWGSWLIINTLFLAIGYGIPWSEIKFF